MNGGLWGGLGAQNLKLLHQLIKQSMLRRTKAECLDLPPKQRIIREVDVPAAAMAEYQDQAQPAKR